MCNKNRYYYYYDDDDDDDDDVSGVKSPLKLLSEDLANSFRVKVLK